MANNFICRKKKGDSCKIWQRECVAWNNCNLKNYGAPCPACTASSPLEHSQCNNCDFRSWKKENYVQ